MSQPQQSSNLAAGSSNLEAGYSSPEGRQVVHEILAKYLTFTPHDYQLDGVCKSLNGVDLMAIVPMGGGKTAYFYMYMLVLLELAKNPALRRSLRTIPNDPAMVIVFPTNGLEIEMVSQICLNAVVINAHTLREARNRGENLWSSAQNGISMILLSPEQLMSRSFELLLYHKPFQLRVCALGIDEIHLLNMWGNGFRKAFEQIGFVAARMPSRIVQIGLTATLARGAPMDNVCKLLGFKRGEYHLIRWSNLWSDVRILFRTLQHGLGGWDFPQFLWVLDSGRKTLVFTRTIHLSFRLLVYPDAKYSML
ncbi:hypothetical protein BU15DRAFT_51507 [Melanogaster broomeanus]|nr:hypothetical protein BU15DRAFT_51507 [Melanogaster broomeanus]